LQVVIICFSGNFFLKREMLKAVQVYFKVYGKAEGVAGRSERQYRQARLETDERGMTLHESRPAIHRHR
jgi:hypothetical protein